MSENSLLLEKIPADLTERLREVRDGLLTNLVEREDAIRLALLATLSSEHLLLVGPPGTAKSLIAQRLKLAFSSPSYFERLLTRFTVPEELFGPLSIKGLEEDRYERLTKSYLPEASIAFLDEIFKANSAILNALLTLLNERAFDNGTKREKSPLIAVIGASNELPEGNELDALFDRFLLRLHVGPVSTQGFPKLLALRGDDPPEIVTKLTKEDLQKIHEFAIEVEVPETVIALLEELRLWCVAEKIFVSDRRWRKVVKLLQVSAITNKRTSVSIWDCWLLQHTLWEKPEDREKIYTWYEAHIGTNKVMDFERLTKMIVIWESKLKMDDESQSQSRDKKGQLLYVDRNNKQTTKTKGELFKHQDGEPLYKLPDLGLDNYNYKKTFVNINLKTLHEYTTKELMTLQYVARYSSYNTSQYNLSEWPELNVFLADPKNRILETGNFSPKVEATKHKTIYIQYCLQQIAEIRKDAQTYKETLLDHIRTMQKAITDHLWVANDLAEPAKRTLDATNALIDALLKRITDLEKGYKALPQEE